MQISGFCFDLLTYPIYYFAPSSLGSPDVIGSQVMLNSEYALWCAELAESFGVSVYLVKVVLVIHCALLTYYGMELSWHMLAVVSIGSGIWSGDEWVPWMDRPWSSTSLNDFWARRYHQTLRTFFRFTLTPLESVPRPIYMLAIFIVSAIYHVLWLFPFLRRFDWYPSLHFFGLAAVGCLLERLFYRHTGRKHMACSMRWAFSTHPPLYHPLPTPQYYPSLRSSRPFKALNLLLNEPRLLGIAPYSPPFPTARKPYRDHLEHHFVRALTGVSCIALLALPFYLWHPLALGAPTVTMSHSAWCADLATRFGMSYYLVKALALGQVASLVCLSLASQWHLLALIGIASGIWRGEEWVQFMDQPWRSTSLNELWGRRYHQTLRGFLRHILTPLEWMPRALYVLAFFVASGLYHAVLFFPYIRRVGFYDNLYFFGLSGILDMDMDGGNSGSRGGLVVDEREHDYYAVLVWDRHPCSTPVSSVRLHCLATPLNKLTINSSYTIVARNKFTMPRLATLILALSLLSGSLADNLFVGCGDEVDGVGTTTYPADAAGCESDCSSMSYTYYTFNADGCSCYNTAPPPHEYTAGDAGNCNGQYQYNLISSPFEFTDVCLDTVYGPQTSTQPSFQACFAACSAFTYASAKPQSTSYPGDVACVCSNDFDGASIVECDVNKYYKYQQAAPSTGSASSKRQLKQRLELVQEKIAQAICPDSMTACVLPGAPGAFECIDVNEELESCGGCMYGQIANSNGTQGVDCHSLPGVSLGGSTCQSGKCVIYACDEYSTLVDGECVSR
ncbi:hypothetical protein P7C73_g941, partial [Tremellales sp. Uapishka_1]